MNALFDQTAKSNRSLFRLLRNDRGGFRLFRHGFADDDGRQEGGDFAGPGAGAHPGRGRERGVCMTVRDGNSTR